MSTFSPILALLRDFTAPNVFNPWRDVDPMDHSGYMGAAQRTDRLLAHFNCKPEFLLIGEAPGYQGCRVSGIPFTSERLILDGSIPRVSSMHRLSTRPAPWSEPSATIVWKALYQLGIAERTACWNAFAFHPHEADNPYSNRTPTRDEVLDQSHILDAVLQYFSGARYVAVGQLAQKALHAAGVSVFATVRHPAHGGATLFRNQMQSLGAGRAA